MVCCAKGRNLELSQDKAFERLTSSQNLASRFCSGHSVSNRPSLEVRQNQQKRFIPEFIKAEAVRRSLTGLESRKEIAEDLGISAPEVGYLKQKALDASRLESSKSLEASTVPETGSDGLSQQTRTGLTSARDLALKRLLSTLGFMDEERLAKASLKDLTNVASAMSKVIDKSMPQDKGSGVTLVVYAPEIKTESAYRVIEVDKG